QPLSDEGLTHASSVMPVDRSSGLAVVSVTVTQSSTPSNRSAPPIFPAATRTAWRIVPLCAEGDESIAVVPVGSSKPSASTSPDGCGVPVETTMPTALLTRTLVPAAGLVLITLPAGVVALGAVVMAPTVRPTPLIDELACACVRPTTFGTFTRGGPLDTTRFITVPISTLRPS